MMQEPTCRIQIESAPPEHTGLGSGTQLGLAVAAGLQEFFGAPIATPSKLARLTGRGERSAVGTYGFAHGGLIVEAGKLAGERLAPLVCHVALPPQWRFVLLCPREERGLFGESEARAFAGLPPVPTQTTDKLCREVLLNLVPAARAAAFEEFSESLYRYGYMAGTCFAQNQGGPFGGRKLADLVEIVRAEKVQGVGQSSWGPVVFALVADSDRGSELIELLRKRSDMDKMDLLLASPNHGGAQIKREER